MLNNQNADDGDKEDDDDDEFKLYNIHKKTRKT